MLIERKIIYHLELDIAWFFTRQAIFFLRVRKINLTNDRFYAMLYAKPKKRWRIGDLADVKMLEDLLNQLREIKNKTGFTLKQIAREAGISARTVRRWVKGTHKPRPLYFREFKKVLYRIIDFYKERGVEIEKII